MSIHFNPRRFLFRALLPTLVGFSSPCQGQLYLSEFMADNDNTLVDAYGNSSDWIEIYNAGESPVPLTGWYLTDNTNNLARWSFPATNLAAKGFLIVFASGEGLSVAGDELHTDFGLSAGGEYLALVHPDGTTIEDDFAFPAQLEDVSYGHAFSGGSATNPVTLIDSGATCRARIPTSASDSAGWQQPGFDDAAWLGGTTGVGYERSSGYASLINLDVGAMYDANASAYIRIPFAFTNDHPLIGLRLKMKYDDGFVAYLNGTQVAADQAPTPLAYDSEATRTHSDAQAIVFAEFDISAHLDALQPGTNVLAIHGLNAGTSSSDFLILPVLEADPDPGFGSEIDPSSSGLLAAPTPGAPNTGVAYLGTVEAPIITPERGFYDGPVQVTISNVTETATVRYTTDGSAPTDTNGTDYAGPITIADNTLLRAAAFKTGHRPSDINTQTYLYLADVLEQDGSGLPPYGNWGNHGPDWEVDPAMTHTVIHDADGETFQLADALLDVPTVSLVTDWDYWWSDADGPVLADGVTPWLGVYADPVGEHSVRRPVSMEFFTADGSETFSEDGVISVVGGGIGGTSANRWKSDKLSMRVSFREKLRHPVFGEEAADRFNGLVFDAHLSWVWTHSGHPEIGATTKFFQDALAGDLQNGMSSGIGAPRSRFVHLYLNGLYWGMYDMHERPDEHFAAEYYGGENEDYDSIKHLYDDTSSSDSDHDGIPYNDNITGGDDASLHAMFALARTDLSQYNNYQALEGALDIDHLIDYLLLNFYVGNGDWAHKNWYATFNRNHPDGRWRYHAWDTEHIIESSFFNSNVSGALAFDCTGKDNTGGPTELHQDLAAESPEYRLRFADHMYRHFFHDGTLTAGAVTAAFWNRVREMDRAVLGEAARWADNQGDYDYSNWYNHIVDLRDNYFPYRSDVVFNQLRNRGLYPATPAPAFEVNGTLRRHGGRIVATDAITMDSAHSVYYTTDGTDPRAVGGTVAGMPYSAPLSFDRPTLLKARARNGGEWSALCEAVFWTDDIPLAVTELMYHAPDGSEADFIEIQNISSQPAPLDGYKLDGAINYTFAAGVHPPLAPGAFLVVVKDLDVFGLTYPTDGIVIAGEYTDNFDNNGERVDLEFHSIDLIRFTYSDARDWPQAADGGGHSLVPRDAGIPDEERGSLDYGGNWRASALLGGSPGYADPTPEVTVVLNEIIAHTDTGLPPPFDSNDQIELYNPTATDAVLTNWYLSDDLDLLDAWPIPNGTLVPAGGFVLFDEDDFHPDRTHGFGLNKAGEQVVLLSPTRVEDAIRFKGQATSASLGRYPDGAPHWLATLPTPETPNQAEDPAVWIRALMYCPAASIHDPEGAVLEYIQLENRDPTSISFESAAGAWRIDGGVSYVFPPGAVLPAGDRAYLVSFDPAVDVDELNLFSTTYGVNPAETTLWGPYRGRLSDQGERIALERPQASDDPLRPLDVSWIVVDEFVYFDRAPWPTGADGTGYPLLRTGLTSWGAPTATDTDADLLLDDWETTYFHSLDPDGDDDGDGDKMTNLEEQISGTDPTLRSSRFIIETIQSPVITWTAVEGRHYSVYWTDDLQQPFQPIAGDLLFPQNSFTDTVHHVEGRNFYLLEVGRE